MKKSHSLRANNLTPKYEIVKKNKFHKKNTEEKKFEAIIINLTELLPRI